MNIDINISTEEDEQYLCVAEGEVLNVSGFCIQSVA